MTPGPKEPTGDQLQHLLRVIVDDLIGLYENGITIRTPKHPEGERYNRSSDNLPNSLIDFDCFSKVVSCALLSYAPFATIRLCVR